MIDEKDFASFLNQYKVTALWSSLDIDTGGALQKTKHTSDLSHECVKEMEKDCLEFFKDNQAMIESDPSRAGHDFWLTRNEHGAGFLDGDWPDDGETLEKNASAFGVAFLYIGDDGHVHHM